MLQQRNHDNQSNMKHIRWSPLGCDKSAGATTIHQTAHNTTETHNKLQTIQKDPADMLTDPATISTAQQPDGRHHVSQIISFLKSRPPGRSAVTHLSQFLCMHPGASCNYCSQQHHGYRSVQPPLRTPLHFDPGNMWPISARTAASLASIKCPMSKQPPKKVQ